MSDQDLNRANKSLVIEAITRVFVERDVTAPAELFHSDYRQHNPSFPNGNAVLPGLIASLSEGFKYEMGMVVAEGRSSDGSWPLCRLGTQADDRRGHLSCQGR